VQPHNFDSMFVPIAGQYTRGSGHGSFRKGKVWEVMSTACQVGRPLVPICRSPAYKAGSAHTHKHAN
jgi:hypothetical protein